MRKITIFHLISLSSLILLSGCASLPSPQMSQSQSQSQSQSYHSKYDAMIAEKNMTYEEFISYLSHKLIN